MSRALLATTLIASISLAASAFAQTAPVGGPDAKGNAPLKHVHTVNDGSAKPGANSFTQGQARQHILNSGYTGVSPLTKGKDGVWRGSAMHNGVQVEVAMDFKGNVTEGAAPSSPATGPAMKGGMGSPAVSAVSDGGGAADMAGAPGPAATAAGHAHHHLRHRHRHAHRRCANPGPNGAACSGIDRNKNGISDKEDRAIHAGAHP